MNLNEHFENRNRFPPEELAKYFGKHVAWNLDGTRIIASGEDDAEVYAAVKAAGYNPEQVVGSYVPFPDEVIIGGGVLGVREADE
jgi:hypothetical protein